MKARTISFSPPDISEEEIAEVVAALRSGWITTGPRTKTLESQLREFTQAAGVACLASATAALECGLRVLGVGPGDEVITSTYTYTASASSIVHVGATPVLSDVAPQSYLMDPAQLERWVTPATRAVIPVDIGGRMADYAAIAETLKAAAEHVGWQPRTPQEKALGRPLILGDGAHSLGAWENGKPSGSVADMTAFSFHAVKNFTTGEGGALAWRKGLFDDDALYRQVILLSLHGQTKDALAKTKAGAWEYDIEFPGWKCNMTDIQAAIGLIQLKRYPSLLARRRELIERYAKNLADLPLELMGHAGFTTPEAQVLLEKELIASDAATWRAQEEDGSRESLASDVQRVENITLASLAAAYPDRFQTPGTFLSSGHLMLTHLVDKDTEFRNRFIEYMGERGVACNVHFKPLPLLTAYKNLGFSIDTYPHTYDQFSAEVTLPLHTLLTDEDVDYICACVHDAFAVLEG